MTAPELVLIVACQPTYGNNEVAFFERHDNHPEGGVIVHRHQPVLAALTEIVRRHLESPEGLIRLATECDVRLWERYVALNPDGRKRWHAARERKRRSIRRKSIRHAKFARLIGWNPWPPDVSDPIHRNLWEMRYAIRALAGR